MRIRREFRLNPIRRLAGGLLLLTGCLHLVSAAVVDFEATSIITIVFGLIYLVIGVFLSRNGRAILWYGAILPLIGMLLSIVGMLMNRSVLGVLVHHY